MQASALTMCMGSSSTKYILTVAVVPRENGSVLWAAMCPRAETRN